MSRTNEIPLEETLVEVIRIIAKHFDGRYHVEIGSDEGGKTIEVRVEVFDPSLSLLTQHRRFPLNQLRECSGRVIVFRVPEGARKKIST
jgi:hypothetical protein